MRLCRPCCCTICYRCYDGDRRFLHDNNHTYWICWRTGNKVEGNACNQKLKIGCQYYNVVLSEVLLGIGDLDCSISALTADRCWMVRFFHRSYTEKKEIPKWAFPPLLVEVIYYIINPLSIHLHARKRNSQSEVSLYNNIWQPAAFSVSCSRARFWQRPINQVIPDDALKALVRELLQQCHNNISTWLTGRQCLQACITYRLEMQMKTAYADRVSVRCSQSCKLLWDYISGSYCGTNVF